MSLIPLVNAWQVDQAILTNTTHLVIIRFGIPTTLACTLMDEIISKAAPLLRRYCVFYAVDITTIPDFNKMYELYDDTCIMFFYRNRHIQVDAGTGNNNKINWALQETQELVDLAEVVWKGARKGKGLVVSPRDYSTKYKY